MSIELTSVYEGWPELPDLRQLQAGSVKTHGPVELREDVRHVEGLELLEQEI